MKRSNLILLGILGAIFLYFTTLQFSTHNYVRKGVIQDSGTIISETRKVSDFRSIHIEDKMMVYFKQDSISKITVEAPENFMPHIKTKVNQQTLVIEKVKTMNMDDTIKVFISNHHLDTIKVGSSAYFKTLGAVTGKELILEFRGESTGDLEVTYELVRCKARSDAAIKLTGNSKEINFSN
ncbi:DUF2807 domain-containing protein [uncultured Aquimarina sp.]|uniref:GIN domain-containing protein n=1 Tax=uncultured Aquimarina sp. TaxID=575652 RepID=UPI00260EABD3|nr:DUF2807 domain-containing protein [uncultured Aquimarina sp.]